MKVIIIKNLKQYKKNQIVNIIDGYAKNFLIPQGYAVPFNESTQKLLNKNINDDALKMKKNNEDNLKLKTTIEQQELIFTLKCFNENPIGSITKKNINKKVKQLGIILPKHVLDNIQIRTFGTTYIPIKLSSKIIAKLKIVINKE